MADTNKSIVKFPIPSRNTEGVTPEQALEGLKGAAGNHARSTYPVGFDWPLSGAVWDNFWAVKNGDFYECSVTPSDLIDLSMFTNTVYVDRGAADGLDGTSWGTAENKIGQAIDAANASGEPTVILVKGGVYERAYSLNNSSAAKDVSVPIAIMAVYGRVEAGCFDSLAWAVNSTYSNVYESTRSAVNHIVDPTRKTGRGYYEPYVNVGTLEECSTTDYSWYSDNTTVYVNNPNDAVSDANARCFLQTSSGSLTGDQNIYLYGLDLQGGSTSPLRLQGGTGNVVVADNCTFRYGVAGDTAVGLSGVDGVQVLDCGLFAAFGCDASANSKDGFNVHTRNDVYPSLLTVNCTAYNNGQITPDSQSNNGITVHDGCKAIDIGGEWLGSVGTNAGHVSDGTQVWHFGSKAGMSDGDVYNGGSISFGAFGVWSGVNEMWLEYCTDVGSYVGRQANSTSTVYSREHSGIGIQGGSGTFKEF